MKSILMADWHLGKYWKSNNSTFNRAKKILHYLTLNLYNIISSFPYERLQPRHPSVIFHDYDIGQVPGAHELLLDISKMRPSGLPYRIGNKYPINVYNYEDL